ncbi:sulfite exporter TauE/SafE family protein [Flavisolibacter tropicus]|nr:sulfite exporter TauE/SafE family protein [Flavisolibacter tropicus]
MIEQPQKKPMTFQIILLISLIGLIAGILSGLVGVGGGIIIVPALVFFLGFSQYQAQGTSLGLLLLPVGIFAVINYYNKGYIDIKVVAIMSIAFIIGGYFGSKLSLILSQDVLRKIFAIVLFYTAFKMLEWDKWIFNLFKK